MLVWGYCEFTAAKAQHLRSLSEDPAGSQALGSNYWFDQDPLQAQGQQGKCVTFQRCASLCNWAAGWEFFHKASEDLKFLKSFPDQLPSVHVG